MKQVWLALFCLVALGVSGTLADLSVHVLDATSSVSIASASCALLERGTGVSLAEAKSNLSGQCVLSYTLSNSTSYIIRLSASGYTSLDYIYTTGAELDTSSIRIPMSAVLDPTAMRVVLHWGKGDHDMDAMIAILRSDAEWKQTYEETFCDRVAYNVDSCIANATGATMELAQDNSGEFQFETITINKLSAGLYSYFVNNYDSGDGWTTQAPTINIYTSEGLIKSFTLPNMTNTDETWHVFNFDVNQVGECTSVDIEVSDTMSPNYYEVLTRYPVTSTIPVSTCAPAAAPDCNTKITGESKACSVFGDPHVVTFTGAATTCTSIGTTALVDNEWFRVDADNVLANSDATAVAALHLTYKKCNPYKVSIVAGQGLPTPGPAAAGAGVHTIRSQGNSLFLDGVNTRIEIQQSGDYFVFAISTPLLGSGICNGCPHYAVNASDPSTWPGGALKRASVAFTIEEAATACANAKLEGFFLDACTMDLALSWDEQFVQNAATSITNFNKAQEPIPEPPVAAPTDSSVAPTDSSVAPTDGELGAPGVGSSSSVVFSAAIIVAFVAVALFH